MVLIIRFFHRIGDNKMLKSVRNQNKHMKRGREEEGTVIASTEEQMDLEVKSGEEVTKEQLIKRSK